MDSDLKTDYGKESPMKYNAEATTVDQVLNELHNTMGADNSAKSP